MHWVWPSIEVELYTLLTTLSYGGVDNLWEFKYMYSTK